MSAVEQSKYFARAECVHHPKLECRRDDLVLLALHYKLAEELMNPEDDDAALLYRMYNPHRPLTLNDRRAWLCFTSATFD